MSRSVTGAFSSVANPHNRPSISAQISLAKSEVSAAANSSSPKNIQDPKQTAPTPSDRSHSDTGSSWCASEEDELTWVLDYVAICSNRALRDTSRLTELGFTHLLCVAQDDVPPPDQDLSLRFTTKAVPIAPSEGGEMFRDESDLLTQLEESIAFIEAARAQAGKVLVYDRRGINRAPMVAVALLMHAPHNLRYKEAQTAIAQKRGCMLLSPAFREILSTEPFAKTKSKKKSSGKKK